MVHKMRSVFGYRSPDGLTPSGELAIPFTRTHRNTVDSGKQICYVKWAAPDPIMKHKVLYVGPGNLPRVMLSPINTSDKTERKA